ncbi:MAG: hypothetical protein ABFS46_02460 [Myxococcota bacterium]
MALPESTQPDASQARALDLWHIRFGWTVIAVFAGLGMLLETMHGLKLGWYLDVDSTTRRFLFTLGHAHGVLIGFVNVFFGLTLRTGSVERERLASRCLVAANVLMPTGFLLGGIDTHGGDPGLATLALVPLGGSLLLIGVVSIALGTRDPGPRSRP